MYVLSVRGIDNASIRLRAPPIAVSRPVYASYARGARELGMVARHAVRVALGHTSSFLCLGIFLNVGLKVGQVRSSGGVTTSVGASLEMPLKNIIAGEGVPAENTHTCKGDHQCDATGGALGA